MLQTENNTKTSKNKLMAKEVRRSPISEKYGSIDFVVERGQTQKNVNITVMKTLLTYFNKKDKFKVLDVPCGDTGFLYNLKKLFPEAELTGADIETPPMIKEGRFFKADLTEDFLDLSTEKFDLITSISGVMMFGNTLRFISNCADKLSPGGTLVITNDNSSTILDRLYFLFFGRVRIFRPVYTSDEALTQNIPLQELIRIISVNGIEIESVKYTSFYKRDLMLLPIAILLYPIQWLHLQKYRTRETAALITMMYPFKQFLFRHYIIVARKPQS